MYAIFMLYVGPGVQLSHGPLLPWMEDNVLKVPKI